MAEVDKFIPIVIGFETGHSDLITKYYSEGGYKFFEYVRNLPGKPGFEKVYTERENDPTGWCSNKKDDSGGFTVVGLTLNSFSKGINTKENAKLLYKISYSDWKTKLISNYWYAVRGNEIKNQDIANLCANSVWGTGASYCSKIKEILGTMSESGSHLGKASISAINGWKNGYRDLFEKLWRRREKFFVTLCEEKPSQKKFLKGWLRRLQYFKFDGTTMELSEKSKAMISGSSDYSEDDDGGESGGYVPLPEEYITEETMDKITYVDLGTPIDYNGYERERFVYVNELNREAEYGAIEYEIIGYDSVTGRYEFNEIYNNIGVIHISAHGKLASRPSFIATPTLESLWDHAIAEYQKKNDILNPYTETVKKIEKIEKSLEDDSEEEDTNDGIISETAKSSDGNTETWKTKLNEEYSKKVSDKKEEILKKLSFDTLRKTLIKAMLKPVKKTVEKFESVASTNEKLKRKEGKKIREARSLAKSGHPLTDEEKSRMSVILLTIAPEYRKPFEMLMQIESIGSIVTMLSKIRSLTKESALPNIMHLKNIADMEFENGIAGFKEMAESILIPACGIASAVEEFNRLTEEEAAAESSEYEGNVQEEQLTFVSESCKNESYGYSYSNHMEYEHESNEDNENESEDENDKGFPCRISICHREEETDTDAMSENSPLSVAEQFVIEGSFGTSFTPTITEGESFMSGDIIAKINGYDVTAPKSGKSIEISNGTIFGQYEYHENVPESRNEISESIDELIETMTEYSYAVEYIKDVMPYTNAYGISSNSETDGQTVNFEINVAEYGYYCNEKRESFERTIKRITGNRNTRTHARNETLDVLKNELVSETDSFISEMISAYENPSLCGFVSGTEGNDINGAFATLSEHISENPENRFSVSAAERIYEIAYFGTNDPEREIRDRITKFNTKATLKLMTRWIPDRMDYFSAIEESIEITNSVKETRAEAERVMKQACGISDSDIPLMDTSETTDYESISSEEGEDEPDESSTGSRILSKISELATLFASYEHIKRIYESNPSSHSDEDNILFFNNLKNESYAAYLKGKTFAEGNVPYSLKVAANVSSPETVYRYGIMTDHYIASPPYNETSDTESSETQMNDISNQRYWLRYLGIATLMNCAMPMYWPTGLVTQSGNIPLPVIMFPLIKPINLGGLLIVIGLGICGIAIYPLIIFANMSDSDKLSIIPLNITIDFIKESIKGISSKASSEMKKALKVLITECDNEINECEKKIREISKEQKKLLNA